MCVPHYAYCLCAVYFKSSFFLKFFFLHFLMVLLSLTAIKTAGKKNRQNEEKYYSSFVWSCRRRSSQVKSSQVKILWSTFHISHFHFPFNCERMSYLLRFICSVVVLCWFTGKTFIFFFFSFFRFPRISNGNCFSSHFKREYWLSVLCLVLLLTYVFLKIKMLRYPILWLKWILLGEFRFLKSNSDWNLLLLYPYGLSIYFYLASRVSKKD